jgi:4-hydroxythreonine-4-phosphate dehydrogenase
MGDPAGVGPELCLQVLSNRDVLNVCVPIVFGNATTLSRVSQKLNLPLPDQVFHTSKLADAVLTGTPAIVDVEMDVDQVEPGKINATTGQASFDFIDRAISAALSGDVDAVVTCPINKEAWQQAGIEYPGHTELFAERANTDRFCMMMTAPDFSCSLVTTHIGYDEVVSKLSVDRIAEVIQLTHESLLRIVGRPPKLITLGLNPHAGEAGLFGNQEEEKIIAPAVKICREQGIDVGDPIPPDTAFLPWRRQQTDGYICMYHDQGLIPFKALNFDTGVNITLGLKSLVRTSVDHGTALDIAWQGKADVSSLISAVNLAAKLT